MICVTIIGLAVGGASTIGVSEHAFRVGLSAGWYTIAWALGAIVMGLFMAKKYREQNITTITELIERHHTKGAVILGVFCQIVIQLVIISLQYIAGGSILHAILPDIFDFHTGMIVSAITFIGITFIGGMWSASLSNVLNIILIYVGILAATIIQFKKIGSMDHLAAALPANVPWFSFIDGVGPVTITSWVVTLITVNLSLQSILQISLGAKDAATAKKGFVWGGILMLPVGVLAAFLGLVAKAMYPDAQAALALPQVIVGLQPVLAGVTLAALWAADVSTACNLLLSAGTLFSSDIYKRFINPQCDQARQLLMTRACIIISGILTLGTCYERIQHFGYDYDRSVPDCCLQCYRNRSAVLPAVCFQGRRLLDFAGRSGAAGAVAAYSGSTHFPERNLYGMAGMHCCLCYCCNCLPC